MLEVCGNWPLVGDGGSGRVSRLLLVSRGCLVRPINDHARLSANPPCRLPPNRRLERLKRSSVTHLVHDGPSPEINCDFIVCRKKTPHAMRFTAT
jgi:hypothetical protein